MSHFIFVQQSLSSVWKLFMSVKSFSAEGVSCLFGLDSWWKNSSLQVFMYSLHTWKDWCSFFSGGQSWANVTCWCNSWWVLWGAVRSSEEQWGGAMLRWAEVGSESQWLSGCLAVTQRGANATFLWLIRVISSLSHAPRGAAGKLPHTHKLRHDPHTQTVQPIKVLSAPAVLLNRDFTCWQWRVVTSAETTVTPQPVKQTEGVCMRNRLCSATFHSQQLVYQHWSGLLFHKWKMVFHRLVPAVPVLQRAVKQ